MSPIRASYPRPRGAVGGGRLAGHLELGRLASATSHKTGSAANPRTDPSSVLPERGQHRPGREKALGKRRPQRPHEALVPERPMQREAHGREKRERPTPARKAFPCPLRFPLKRKPHSRRSGSPPLRARSQEEQSAAPVLQSAPAEGNSAGEAIQVEEPSARLQATLCHQESVAMPESLRACSASSASFTWSSCPVLQLPCPD